MLAKEIPNKIVPTHNMGTDFGNTTKMANAIPHPAISLNIIALGERNAATNTPANLANVKAPYKL